MENNANPQNDKMMNGMNNGAEAADSKSGNWKGVMIGGIPGIMLGAGGVLATQAFVLKEDDPVDEPEGIPVAHSVNDDMTFSEAFAAARAEVGPGGAFCWHGNVYSTYRSDDPEWIAMGSEGQADHCHNILLQVHPQPYVVNNGTTTNPVDPQVPHDSDDHHDPDNNPNHPHSPVNPEDPEAPTDPEPVEADVHITDIETDPESGAQVAIGEVDGVPTGFVDEDGDGVVDVILHDGNQDGWISEDEVFSAEGAGITMGELADQMDQGQDVELYEGQPDYSEEDTDTYGDFDNEGNVEGF